MVNWIVYSSFGGIPKYRESFTESGSGSHSGEGTTVIESWSEDMHAAFLSHLLINRGGGSYSSSSATGVGFDEKPENWGVRYKSTSSYAFEVSRVFSNTYNYLDGDVEKTANINGTYYAIEYTSASDCDSDYFFVRSHFGHATVVSHEPQERDVTSGLTSVYSTKATQNTSLIPTLPNITVTDQTTSIASEEYERQFFKGSTQTRIVHIPNGTSTEFIDGKTITVLDYQNNLLTITASDIIEPTWATSTFTETWIDVVYGPEKVFPAGAQIISGRVYKMDSWETGYNFKEGFGSLPDVVGQSFLESTFFVTDYREEVEIAEAFNPRSSSTFTVTHENLFISNVSPAERQTFSSTYERISNFLGPLPHATRSFLDWTTYRGLASGIYSTSTWTSTTRATGTRSVSSTKNIWQNAPGAFTTRIFNSLTTTTSAYQTITETTTMVFHGCPASDSAIITGGYTQDRVTHANQIEYNYNGGRTTTFVRSPGNFDVTEGGHFSNLIINGTTYLGRDLREADVRGFLAFLPADLTKKNLETSVWGVGISATPPISWNHLLQSYCQGNIGLVSYPSIFTALWGGTQQSTISVKANKNTFSITTENSQTSGSDQISFAKFGIPQTKLAFLTARESIVPAGKGFSFGLDSGVHIICDGSQYKTSTITNAQIRPVDTAFGYSRPPHYSVKYNAHHYDPGNPRFTRIGRPRFNFHTLSFVNNPYARDYYNEW